MRLRLDHLIIRAADPAATLAELARRAGADISAEVEQIAGLAGGLVRAGALDIEVVGIGREAPPRPHGYGVGFVADVGLIEASAALRALGFPTSPPFPGAAGRGSERRRWRAVQVHGLLPDPFPVPTRTGRPARADRVIEAATGVLSRMPPVAPAATRRAGTSMVVVTEYGFDVGAWRSAAGAGPEVLAVHLGTGGHGAAWGRVPRAGGVALHLHDRGPIGVTGVVLRGRRSEDRQDFSVGEVRFAFRAARVSGPRRGADGRSPGPAGRRG